jgi:transcriptional regulator with XRE-family HTH domain
MDEISKSIKKIRKNKNITLKTLSEKTDLSISFLSQVERGVSSLALTSLKKIADALGVSLNELVSYEETDYRVYKKDHPIYLRMQNDYQSLQVASGKFAGKKMEAIIFEIAPHSNMTPLAHEGEEFYYVINGVASCHIDGEEYELVEGETIHFPSTVKHAINNKSEHELKILSVVTPSLF